jgi:hypothetical protein
MKCIEFQAYWKSFAHENTVHSKRSIEMKISHWAPWLVKTLTHCTHITSSMDVTCRHTSAFHLHLVCRILYKCGKKNVFNCCIFPGFFWGKKSSQILEKNNSLYFNSDFGFLAILINNIFIGWNQCHLVLPFWNLTFVWVLVLTFGKFFGALTCQTFKPVI